MDKPVPGPRLFHDKLPPNTFVKRIPGADAEHLGELLLIRSEVEGSRAAMQLYFDKYAHAPEGSAAFLIKMSLFRDAVIQFAGCFTKDRTDNVRMNPEEVFGHIKGWEKLANWFHDLRDFYAAHSFGPQRQHDVGALMEWNETRTRYRVLELTENYIQYLGPNTRRDRDQTLHFMTVAVEFANKSVKEARLALRKHIMELGPEAVFRFPDYVPTIPDPTEIRIRRERFREKRGVATPKAPKDRSAKKASGSSSHRDRSDQRSPGPDEEAASQE